MIESCQNKFWTCIGGETQLKLPGEYQVIEIVRQIQSPYTVVHTKDPIPTTIITFNYPCLPREVISVKVREPLNGIDRAIYTIKNSITKLTKLS